MLDPETNFEPFVYPNKDERIEIQKSQPLLSKLYLEVEEVEKTVHKFSDFIKENDFLSWKNRFNNKVRKMEFSYVLLKFYYSKGILDTNWAEKANNGAIVFLPSMRNEAVRTNKFLFDYATENFFYHYISAADIIYHLLNTHFKLEVKSGSNFNKRVIDKLRNFTLSKTLEDFETEIRSFRKDRNDLAHNFSFNEIDLRSKENLKDGKKVITMGNYSYTSSSEVLVKIEDSISHFSKLMKLLNNELR